MPGRCASASGSTSPSRSPADRSGNYRIFTSSNGVPYASLRSGCRVQGLQRATGKSIKWWHGYLMLQPADHFTGLPLEAHGFAADEHEYKHYVPAVTKAIATTGHVPSFVTADKGHSMREPFEWSCERGITLVAPYRQANGSAPPRAEATVDFDEHGVPFCRACHVSGTDQVGFVLLPAASAMPGRARSCASAVPPRRPRSA